MKLFVLLFAALLFIPLSAAQNCIEPTSELHITKDTVLCDGNYRASRIVIETANTTLHCSGAVLEGGLGSEGIVITQPGVKLKSCTLIAYQKAITLANAQHPSFEKVELKNNVIAIRAINTPFKPRGILFKDNERNIVHEQKDEASRATAAESIENIVSKDVLVLLNISESHNAAAKKKVSLKKTVEVTSDGTTFTLSIIAKEDIANLLVYEHVPKELAADASEVSFLYPDVQVVNSDPDFLIPIGRVKVNTAINIEYSLKKKMSPADPLPSTVFAESEEGQETETEEPDAEIQAPADISDLSQPFSAKLAALFFLITVAVFAVIYFIEKKASEQH